MATLLTLWLVKWQTGHKNERLQILLRRETDFFFPSVWPSPKLIFLSLTAFCSCCSCVCDICCVCPLCIVSSSHCPRCKVCTRSRSRAFPSSGIRGPLTPVTSTQHPAIPANTGTNLGWHSVSIFKQRWVHYHTPTPSLSRPDEALCQHSVVSFKSAITICLVNVGKEWYCIYVEMEIQSTCWHRNHLEGHVICLLVMCCDGSRWSQCRGAPSNGSTLIWARVSIYHSVIVSCLAPVSPLINW